MRNRILTATVVILVSTAATAQPPARLREPFASQIDFTDATSERLGQSTPSRVAPSVAATPEQAEIARLHDTRARYLSDIESLEQEIESYNERIATTTRNLNHCQTYNGSIELVSSTEFVAFYSGHVAPFRDRVGKVWSRRLTNPYRGGSVWASQSESQRICSRAHPRGRLATVRDLAELAAGFYEAGEFNVNFNKLFSPTTDATDVVYFWLSDEAQFYSGYQNRVMSLGSSSALYQTVCVVDPI